MVIFFSQRTAYSPAKFHHVARPPWFTPGSQQDCSEFLKYLLDRIEEEDKVISNLSELKEKIPHKHMHSNIIEDTFEGKLLVCHRCRRCNYVSYCEEVFTDLPLAFPQNNIGVDRDFSKGLGKPPVVQSVENTDVPSSDRSLKGGDIGQRPSVPSISSNGKGEGESSSESGPSSPTSNYSLPKSSGSQSKASNHGVGAEDPSISLEEMLGYFFEPEILEGSNQYHCEQCQSLQDAERSVVISKAPSFLVLTLKRFSYNVTTHQRSKILQSVTYPLKLKLSNNIIRVKEEETSNHHGNQTKGGSHVLEERKTPPIEECLIDEKIEAPPSKCTKQDLECASQSSEMPVADSASSALPLENFPSETMYALTSVVVHSGVSSESGHYYCYARPSGHVVQHDDVTANEDSDKTSDGKDTKKPLQLVATDNHSWCLFNDSRVSPARFETFSDITKRFPKDTPYVLIYKNISKYIGPSHVNEPSVSGVAVETKECKIRQDLLDAVNLDNLLYLQVSRLDFS